MLSLLLLALAAGPATTEIPVHHAAEPRAAAVTESSLLANERFWPYRVALKSDGSVGVLVRVEDGGLARVDFGRDGKRNLPVSETDLVERANEVRLGMMDKTAPNFVLAIGPRLVDSAGEKLHPYPMALAMEKPGFLCVFVDPSAANFAQIASALAPLSERHGVGTILFPQGEHTDADVREKLRAAKWTVPFVYDHLADAYTRSLLDDGSKPPILLLQTSEGRVVYESPWRSEVVPELTKALERAFGGKPATVMSNP